ncbi:hypothetical protein DRO59_08370 [Candidatus Bathyarchaeota archaeon]|nr:MAG: hypothetical protein DRO59_08370 [Candidatus Bathyarchaeota archaeon]
MVYFLSVNQAVRTCKVKLSISEERKQDVLETFKQYNFAVNFYVDKAWGPRKKIVNKFKLQKLAYYPLRERTGLQADLVCSACRKACNAVRLCVVNWSKKRKASKPKLWTFFCDSVH